MKLFLMIAVSLVLTSTSYARGSKECMEKLLTVIGATETAAGSKNRELRAVLSDALLLQQGIQGSAVTASIQETQEIRDRLTKLVLDLDETCLK